MKTEVVLTIDFGNDRIGAERAYAHLIGVNERELYPRESPGYSFTGACIPSMLTLLRPAHVTVRSVDER